MGRGSLEGEAGSTAKRRAKVFAGSEKPDRPDERQ